MTALDGMRRSTVAVASDGVRLAVSEYGDASRPTVVLVHGYPDDQRVWDGVVAALASDFHVVAYDVRGAGESEAPAARSGYRIEQLNRDLATVIAMTSPDEPVHLLAHDWGSIQSWGAVTDPAFAGRLRSFTSVSGPSFDMAAIWARPGRARLRDVLRQGADSWYGAVFQLPWLPELLVKRGAIESLVRRGERVGLAAGDYPPAGRRQERDALNGIELYRANMGRTFSPKPRQAVCPVLVLAPESDTFVTVPLATQAPVPYVPDLQTRVIPGNHWIVEQDPDLIVEHFRAFVGAL